MDGAWRWMEVQTQSIVTRIRSTHSLGAHLRDESLSINRIQSTEPHEVVLTHAHDDGIAHARVKVFPIAKVLGAENLRPKVGLVINPQVLFDIRGGRLGAVEGHVGENVVDDMRVDDMVQAPVHVAAHRPVNGRERAAEPGPFLRVEVRDALVRVLHESDGAQIEVADGLRYHVVEENRGEAPHAHAFCQDQEAYHHTDVAGPHKVCVLRLEKSTAAG
mmetsp:Transcript_24226/g.78192  ORF Transcript_24226/g.78192 Transcript_24226/m.78192 type:complete len:218 (+) Transcript_24226:113-766(+)